MPDLSPEFRQRLDPLLGALAQSLGHNPYELRLDPAGHRVRLDGEILWIPVRYEVHWRRFHAVPTELVREAAYWAKRLGHGAADEADCEAFAEAFLRDNLLWSE